MDSYEFPVDSFPEIGRCNHLKVHPEYFRGRDFQYAEVDTFHLFQYAARFHVGKRQLEVRPGDWVLCPAGFRYGHLDARFAPGTVIYFHFSYPKTKGKRIAIPIHGSLGPHFREIWHECLSTVADGRGADEVLKRASSSGLHRILLRVEALGRLGLLDNRASGALTRADLAVDEVASFLKDYLMEPLPLGILAQRYSITRDYLSKCFRKRFGLTLSQYRLKCRMEEALYHIQKSTLSFSAIAAQVGFHDPHHFNKRVRKYFKKNPSELRGEGQRERASSLSRTDQRDDDDH